MAGMFEHVYPAPGQQPLFPPDPVEALIERLAAEAHAEIARMVAAALEAVDRHIAFIHRSRAQRRRFERYRELEAALRRSP